MRHFWRRRSESEIVTPLQEGANMEEISAKLLIDDWLNSLGTRAAR
jgi:hypothetical protein